MKIMSRNLTTLVREIEDGLASAIGEVPGPTRPEDGRFRHPIFAANRETAVTHTLASVGIAFTCAVATGLVFGVAPAVMAARLDPVVALASE